MHTMSRIIDRIFDSSASANGNLNRPIIELAVPVSDIQGFAVMSVTVPFTYSVVNERNNKFRIKTYLSSGTYYTATLPPITATDLGFAATLQSVLSELNLGFTITVQLSTTTGRLLFYSGVGQAFTIDFNVENSAGDILGFQNREYTSTALVTAGPQGIQSPNIADLNGGNLLYIHDRTLGSSLGGALQDNSNRADIIADIRIPEFTSSRQQITFDNNAPTPYTIELNNYNRAELYLSLANSEDILDLNGASFQIKIRFWVRDVSMNYEVGTDGDGNRNVMQIGQEAKNVMRESEFGGKRRRRQR